MDETPQPPSLAPMLTAKGMPLWKIMDLLDQTEQDLIELSEEEMRDLGFALRQKVDGYKQFTDFAKNVEITIGTWIEELATAKKSVGSKVERLKKHMLDLMKKMEMKELPGFVHRSYIKKNSAPKITYRNEEPDSKLRYRFPRFIKCTYSYDYDAINAAIKAGEDLSEIVESCETGEHLRFGVSKQGVN